MNKYNAVLARNDEEFQDIIKEIMENPKVQEMKKYKVHGNTSCLSHCYDVAYYAYKFCKKKGWDYKSAARAGLLHDFYLYDWRIKNSHKRPHAYTHPRVAYNNAKQQFKLNSCEKDIILTHMWPVTFFTIPLYYESLVITIIDKQCATAEFFKSIKSKFKKPSLAV